MSSMTDICSGKACLAANYMPPAPDSAAERMKKLMVWQKKVTELLTHCEG